MNVFNLDLNVAVESDSFNEAGNLLRRWGVNWRDVFKHWNDNLKRKFFSFLGEWETSLFFLLQGRLYKATHFLSNGSSKWEKTVVASEYFDGEFFKKMLPLISFLAGILEYHPPFRG